MNVEKNSKAGHETGGQDPVCRAECLAFRNPVAGGRDSHIHLSVTVGHNACQGKITRPRLRRMESAGLMDVRGPASARTPAQKQVERLRRSVREKEIIRKAIDRRVAADSDPSPGCT